jgi:hypothetical protein
MVAAERGEMNLMIPKIINAACEHLRNITSPMITILRIVSRNTFLYISGMGTDLSVFILSTSYAL